MPFFHRNDPPYKYTYQPGLWNVCTKKASLNWSWNWGDGNMTTPQASDLTSMIIIIIPSASTPCWHKLKEGIEEETRGESPGRSRGRRDRRYDRNEKPTHVHINVLHSTMSPSHRKKGSIYRRHSGPTVPPWSVSEGQVVFPLLGLSPWLILLAYRRDPQLHFTSQHVSGCTRWRPES